MENNGASPFVPFTLPLSPAATLRIFVTQLAFEAELDRQLADADVGLLYAPSPVTARRAVAGALAECGPAAMQALNAVEV